jgi:hypothetical protein
MRCFEFQCLRMKICCRFYFKFRRYKAIIKQTILTNYYTVMLSLVNHSKAWLKSTIICILKNIVSFFFFDSGVLHPVVVHV